MDNTALVDPESTLIPDVSAQVLAQEVMNLRAALASAHAQAANMRRALLNNAILHDERIRYRTGEAFARCPCEECSMARGVLRKSSGALYVEKFDSLAITADKLVSYLEDMIESGVEVSGELVSLVTQVQLSLDLPEYEQDLSTD